jgi:hypothetical protein
MAVYKFSTNSLKTPLKYSSWLAGNPVFVPPTDYQSIATTTAGTSTTTLSFTSIPSTFSHLQIRISGGNGSGQNVRMQFNSDTGLNYMTHRLSANNGTSVSSGVTGPSWDFINLAGNAGLNQNSPSIVDILDYTSTSKNKTVRALTGWDNNGSGYIDYNSGLWFATPAAITRIDLTQTSNWANGSTAALYGIKG